MSRARGALRHAGTIDVLPVFLVASLLAATASAAAPAATIKPGDREELDAFLEGVVAAQREILSVPGGAVAVVAGGEVILARGYGEARPGVPVDPATTLFRVGSITKVLTWIAALQLAAAGRLDLGADIAPHLPDALRSQLSGVTLEHLMTHSAGFEDRVLDLFSWSAQSLRPLSETLVAQLPHQARTAGAVSVYSNHGCALAGLVVERVAGVAWEEYVEANILAPAGMRAATVRQPVPEAMRAHLATGYRVLGGRPQPVGFEYVPIAPSGSLSASASAMGRLMIALLRDGEVDGARLLPPGVALGRRGRPFANAPGLLGVHDGWLEMHRNGVRILGHDGSVLAFHAVLALLPEHDVGFFAAYNADPAAQADRSLLHAFLDRYFRGAPPSPAAHQAHAMPPPYDPSGEYSSLRRSTTSLTSLGSLFRVVRIERGEDLGTFTTAGLGKDDAVWRFVETNQAREVGGDGRLAFRQEADGALYLFPNAAAAAYVRNRWFETRGFQVGVLALILALLAGGAILGPLRLAGLAVRGADGAAPSPGSGLGAVAGSAACVCLISFFGVTAAVLGDRDTFVFGVPAVLDAALWLPQGAAALTAVAAVSNLRAWVRRDGTGARRARDSAVWVAATLALIWLSYWNLLGLHAR